MVKKILALLMALCLGLTMFTACGSKEDAEKTDEKQEEKKDEKKDEKEASATDEAKKVVESFLDSYLKFDMKEAAKYVDDDSFIDELGIESKDDLVEVFMSEAPAELGDYADFFEPVIEKMFDKVLDSMDYKIKDAEEDGDEVKVTVELITADFDSVDIEAVLGDAMNDEKIEELATELLESGEITEDMTEEEVTEILFEEIVKIAEDAIKDLEVETTSEEAEIVVVKDGDDWVINVEESDIE